MEKDTPEKHIPRLHKTPHSEREERILAFWKEKGIFEKTVNTPAGAAPRADYTFYDGPPFATGLPHYGHIVPNTIKDVIPRFKTMQGYRVRRRWGWDCHGLPVETLVEKELGLSIKKDILNYGIERFNEAARQAVMRYVNEWKHIIPRLGRFVDMEHDYRTMDASYTETVWWEFKQLHEKGLIYEGFKSLYICPRCETTLSNFEVAQGYKDITDISVYVKFELTDEPGTFVLAWTTTPWTLPGNVALAVNPNINYSYVQVDGAKYVVATNRIPVLFKSKTVNVLREVKGEKLIGLQYKPVFNYYNNDRHLQNRENGWKIYAADFVTTETGTGIVHIAPAFGADDYELCQKNKLPFVQHVNIDGTFKREVIDFVGMHVKPKDTEQDKYAHQSTDIEIIKWLAHKGFLFDKEKIIHSYPHCWRCETPLLNYAASSWFVRVTEFRDKLVAENKKVSWVPPEAGDGRFGNWLLGARDWAISRSRFWGAPIPVWREKIDESVKVTQEKLHVIGSLDELKQFSRSRNTYYVMRHGEAENNVLHILSGDPKTPHHLTPKGKKQVEHAAKALKKIKFDLVFASPFVRTQETLDIIKKKLGWNNVTIHTTDQIRELGVGNMDGQDVNDFVKGFGHSDRFERAPEGGETYADIKKRMGDFLYDLERKYENKIILIITHEAPAFLLSAAAMGLDRKQALALRGDKDFIVNAEIKKVDFTPLPHNAEYELDLHRPYIDNLELKTAEGHKLTRVPEVFDCWFESGSMPYGEVGYRGAPIEEAPTKESPGLPTLPGAKFDPKAGILGHSKGFPADFIAEGLDQTRGWFYSMLVLGVALFGRTPYKKVIANGLVLAEDGEKMSKLKQNYPDLMLVVDKYGADSLRFYLMSSPVVRGQDLRFSERGVDEVTKKVVNRLLNVVTFYEMYVEKSKIKYQKSKVESQNILDAWIDSRLNETAKAVTQGLEAGELDRASRPFIDLVDDLSTWYLRRSRDRFKGENEADKQDALITTNFVLIQVAKLLAPFMPFLAEDIYRRVGGDRESVHLESWPKLPKTDSQLLDEMQKARAVASQGLEARMRAKMNVRQPLKALKVKGVSLFTDANRNTALLELIKDEVNVKEIVFDPALNTEVELDLNITSELIEEGQLRELVRAIQDMRKEKKLSPNDRISIKIEADQDTRGVIEKFGEQIKRITSLKEIIVVDGSVLKVEIV